MEWGMMEPIFFLSQTVTAISTPYCLRWHKSRPMVGESSCGVGWHEIDVLCLSINAPHRTGQMGLFLKIQHWYCFIRLHGASHTHLYDVFVFQSSLLLIYTSGAFNDTEFCLCMIFFLFHVKNYWNDLPIQAGSIDILFKIHFLPLAKSTASQFHKPAHLNFRPYWLHYIPLSLTPKNITFPHIVYSCFVWISEQKAFITPQSINWWVA